MGIFGWSYPPGCSGPPEYDEQCEMCGKSCEVCECPECSKCDSVGDPKCYQEHGMIETESQKQYREWQAKAEVEERDDQYLSGDIIADWQMQEEGQETKEEQQQKIDFSDDFEIHAPEDYFKDIY